MNRTPMSQSYVNSQAGQDQPANQQLQQQQTNQASSSSSNNNNNGQQTGSNLNNQGQVAGGTGNSSTGAGNAAASGAGMLTGEQMPQLMCATELTNLLLEFAFSVFVNKPQDIVEYAASYFNQLQTRRTSPAQQQQQQQQPLAANYGKRASSDSQRSNISQNSINNDNSYNNNIPTNNSIGQSSSQNNNDYQEDDFDSEAASFSRGVNFANNSTNLQQQQQQQFPPQTKLSYNRRKSVFAEQYDPANDQEDDENNRVVHSKTDEQRIRLAKAIKSIFIFRSVDSQDMTQILDAMFEVKVSAGDVVIRQGDDGDNFYVVERGKFQIYVTQDDGSRQIRGEYENNGSFGELALMYNQPRAATVVALTDGSLWAMDRNTFRRIVLKSAFKKRKEYEALFEKVSVLQCLNVSILEGGRK